MAEQIINLYDSTLGSGYTAGSGTMIVASASGLPATGTYSLLIRDATTKVIKLIFRVASRSGTTLSGASEGSDVNASSGDLVSGGIATAASMAHLLADMSQIGLYASLPSTPLAGTRYRCTDIPVELVYNGSAWKAFYRGGLVTLPSTTAFSTINSASIVTNGISTLTATDQNKLYGQEIALPARPYTVLAGFCACSGGGYSGGLYVRESGTKIVTFSRLVIINNEFQLAHFPDHTTMLVGGVQDAVVSVNQPINFFYIKLIDDNVNFTVSIGASPETCYAQIVISRTNYLTPAFIGWWGAFTKSTLFDWTVS